MEKLSDLPDVTRVNDHTVLVLKISINFINDILEIVEFESYPYPGPSALQHYVLINMII